MSDRRIVIIEDNKALAEELAHLLKLQGFEPFVCKDFANAAEEALLKDPACVVVDLRLPNTDGHEIVRDIRAKSSVPVIILTSVENEFDEVMAMNLGADDYILKPYKPAVLLAHIEAMLRRSGAEKTSSALSYKGVSLDPATLAVSYGDSSIELTRNEFKILQMLIKNPKTVIARSELMCELWESDAFVDDNTLTVNINRLRKTLLKLGVPDDMLKTHRGSGYSFG